MTPHSDPREPETMPQEIREALNAWADSSAPGEDRLATMALPPLSATKAHPRRSKRFAYFAQAAAGLALFVAGFAAGTSRGSSSPQVASAPPTIMTAPTPAVKSDFAPNPAPTPVSAPTPPVPTNESPAVQLAAEECKSPQVYQGTDGRIRINTVLCKTGSHMTWVVNPRLEVAKLSTPSSTIQEN